MKPAVLTPVLLSFLVPISLSTMADTQQADLVELETQIDDGLKDFGYLSGLALSCVATDQRVEVEKETMKINARINQLLGGDRAFIFAASFGYGTNILSNAEECEEVLIRFENRVEGFWKDTGESQ